MALIKCPECGKEISDQAASCPNCGHPLQQKNVQFSEQSNLNAGYQIPPRKKKGHGCLFTVIGVIVFFGIVGAAIIGTVGENAAIQKAVSGVSDSSEYITMEEYNKIESGMSYDDVKDIVGSEGEVSVQSEAENIKITLVTWYGDGMAGSNANVTFMNGEVTAKAQVGLK